MPSFLRLGRNLVQFVDADNPDTGLAEQIRTSDVGRMGGFAVLGALGERAVIRVHSAHVLTWSIGVETPGAGRELREVWFMSKPEHADGLFEASESLYLHETERALRNRIHLTEEMMQPADFSKLKQAGDLVLACVPQFRELAQERSMQTSMEFTRAIVGQAEKLFAWERKGVR